MQEERGKSAAWLLPVALYRTLEAARLTVLALADAISRPFFLSDYTIPPPEPLSMTTYLRGSAIVLHASLPTLPLELKALIVEQLVRVYVCQKVEGEEKGDTVDCVWCAHEQAIELGPADWDEPGRFDARVQDEVADARCRRPPIVSAMSVISRVNKEFAALAFPYLWKARVAAPLLAHAPLLTRSGFAENQADLYQRGSGLLCFDPHRSARRTHPMFVDVAELPGRDRLLRLALHRLCDRRTGDTTCIGRRQAPAH